MSSMSLHFLTLECEQRRSEFRLFFFHREQEALAPFLFRFFFFLRHVFFFLNLVSFLLLLLKDGQSEDHKGLILSQ